MGARFLEWLKLRWPVVPPVSIVVMVASVVALISPSWERDVTIMMIYVALVVALYTFVGNSGVLSFGHASFLAISAYGSAILTMAPMRKSVVLPSLPHFFAGLHMNWLTGMLVAALAAAFFAFLVGYPLMKLKGIEAAVATFAVTVIVYTVASEWKAFTTGKTSINVTRSTDFTRAMVFMLLIILIAWLYQRSRFGLRVRAAREDEEAARAVGINVHKERLIAFVLSGFLSGLGGVLYGHYLGSFWPGAFWTDITFLPIAMLVVGGMKSLSGAILGALSVSTILEILRIFENGLAFGEVTIAGPISLREMGTGLLLLLILLLRPRGITGGREITWPFTAREKLQKNRDPTGSLIGGATESGNKRTSDTNLSVFQADEATLER
jgi:branched-chain amino acid transport system permease protein